MFIRYLTHFLSFLILICIGSTQTQAQNKTVNKRNLQWPQYYNQLIISEKISILSDAGYRFQNGFQEPSQYIIRTGVAHKLTNKIRITAGLAHLGFFTDSEMDRIEIRPFQEIQFKEQYGFLGLNHRLRVEERFFQSLGEIESEDGNSFNWRFRYLIALKYPILHINSANYPQSLSLIVAEEILINAGKDIVYNLFDQNRLQLGLSYAISPQLSISLLYSHHFVAKNAPASYNRDAVTWLRIKHSIDLRKRT